jgi:hypothetical protein
MQPQQICSQLPISRFADGLSVIYKVPLRCLVCSKESVLYKGYVSCLSQVFMASKLRSQGLTE